MKILVYHPRAETYARFISARCPQADLVATADETVLRDHIGDADVLLVERLPLDVLRSAGNLRWIQSTHAGVERLLGARQYVKDALLTTAKGIHGEVMADYAFGTMLMLQWNFPQLLRHQRQRQWREIFVEPLSGKTLGVVGLGAIGREIARRGPSFGMRVLGLNRSGGEATGVSRVFSMGELHEMLPLCDFLVLAIPATDQTVRMIGEREFRAMKRTSRLVNIARGSIVDEDALVGALREGWIAGAALDVFEREPLPSESPLWGMENVIITPHSAGNPENYEARVTDIFAENFERFRAGRPLLNEVDFSQGY